MPSLPNFLRLPLTSLLLLASLSGCHAVPTAASGSHASSGAFEALKRHQGGRDVAALVDRANAPLAKRDADVVALKYDLLADNAFSFYRGTAFIFYADVARQAALRTAIAIPLMGDLHLENLGTYQTATGTVAFDLNDFDEAASGPYTWELARLAVSIHLAARESGLEGDQPDGLVAGFLKAYHAHLDRLDPAALKRPLASGGQEVKAAMSKAEDASRTKFLKKLGRGGQFEPGKKIRHVSAEVGGQVAEAVASYARGRREGTQFFRVKDVAARLAGTASLGRYRYVAWLEGPSGSDSDDLVLELKEASAPTLQPRSAGNQADRVLAAYHYFLPAPDPLLGKARLRGLDFVVRELSPAKESVDLATLTSTTKFERFLDTVALATARAHARSGQRAAILQDLAGRAPALAGFAATYASQVAVDWKDFKRSMKK